MTAKEAKEIIEKKKPEVMKTWSKEDMEAYQTMIEKYKNQPIMLNRIDQAIFIDNITPQNYLDLVDMI